MTALATAEAAMPAAATESIEAIPVYGVYDGRDWLTREMVIIAMTKALTDFVERHGHGMWLEDDAVSFTRAELYNKAWINGWTYAHDVEARKRLRIWYFRIREREAADV